MESSPLILFILVCLGAVLPAAAAEPPRPNVVIIFTDDQGYGDLGSYGLTTAKTPHLDRMAEDGTRFTSFYSQPVCGPARSALLTGRDPVRSKGWGMPASEITFAELMQDAGYATACIGKWDVSNRKPIIPRMPNAKGFDYYWGPLGANDAGHVVLHENNTLIGKDEDLASLSRRFTDKSIEWMAQQVEANREQKTGNREPFLLYLCHTMMHTVIDASPEFRGRTGNGLYADTLEELDHECGRLLGAIDELGIAEETLVIFTSDNGPWSNDQERQHAKQEGNLVNDRPVPWSEGPEIAWGDSGPLREGKASSYEGGVRVPCLVRWPGTVPAGRVNDAIFATLDFLPTFAHLAGFDVPQDRPIDGVNQIELLTGESEVGNRERYFYQSGQHGVREGKWKVLKAGRDPKSAKRTYPKDYGTNGIELYNLDEDISETTNLADQHPEIVERLLAIPTPAQEEKAKPKSKGKAKAAQQGEAAHSTGSSQRPNPVKSKPESSDLLALNYHLMHPGGLSSPGDPNAAFHFDGTYHLHYILNHQWNGKRSFSFVHVTSPDMLHWTWQPTKLQPSFTGHGMFSGTGFLTKEDTPAVIYHGQASAKNWIALAKDRELSAWENPYPVEVAGAPEGMRQWDPDCFLIGDTYYAISGGKNPPLFKSDDLKNWTYVGPFLSHEPDDVVLGEDVSCANFFPIDDPVTGGQKWMLLCISHPYGCRYYLGDWDSEKEQFVPETHARLNWPQEGQSPGKPMFLRDIFAPESVLTPDGRRVMWAWLATVDERLRQKTIQSLPRELSLAGDGTLRLRPARELETLRHDPRVFEDVTVEPEARPNGGLGAKRIFAMGDNAWEIRATVAREEATKKRFGFRLFTNAQHEGLPITIQPASGTIRVGTTEAPFAVADLPEGEDLELRIFIDRYLVEVFANDRVALVASHLDGREIRGVDAYTFGAPVTFEKIEAWRMKSTTKGYDEARQNPVWEPDTGVAPPKPEPAAAAVSPRKPGEVPNFVVINIDDLGYADIEPFSDRFETPNLARMAAEGRTFSSFYSASSVCTPSRAALLTGCYPARIDLLHNDLEMGTPNHGVLWPGDRKGLNPEEITIAEMLKDRGYATACIGKWHLGDQPRFLPTRQGFDRYFGIPFSNDMAMREPFPRPLPLVRGERVIKELLPAKEGGQDLLTKRYTEEALRFLEEVSRSRRPGTTNLGKQPFFLYLPHSMIHGPLAVSPEFRDSTGKGLRVDAIAEIDWSVGQILNKLRELGVAENTLVLFTSDNGGAYRPSRPGGGSNFPYSGGKGSPAEGGFRVPTIAWWPGTIPAGTSTDLMASTVDLLPTFAALSGKPHEPNPDRPVDGLDLSALFQGELPATSPRDRFVYYTDNIRGGGEARQPRRLTAVRQGPWKLYIQRASFPLAGGQGAGQAEIEPGALFHVVDDPGETTDVAGEHPEAVKRLRSFADEVIAELGEKVGEGSAFRPAGFVPKEQAKPLNDRTGAAEQREQPDVLFIAIDDMNDWTTLFDPANPIHTPNLERLAARGAFFTHAYCATPGCNPSRTAILTGLRPTTSGVYQNNHEWRKALPDAVTLPQYFAQHGYVTRGGGKILHHGPSGREPEDNPSFQQFFDRIPFPMPKIRDGAFGCFDWGPVAADEMPDTPMIEWAARELGREHGAPLFLATGIFMPHLPHFAPPEIFDLYPFEGTVMPPMPPDDLDDVPPLGIEMARKEWNLWKGYLFDDPPEDSDPASLKNLVRAYQASSTYADDMVGRLLDQLDATGRADNTIIVLWSDHGYHLGDKQSVVKFTLWEKANHVPFLIVAPGVTKPGTRIDTPVSLAEIYATLAELAGLPEKEGIDSRSLVPLLKDPGAAWEAPALMTMGRGNHAIRTKKWRYIRYADGTEELYDCETDGAWNHDNLLVGPEADEHAPVAEELREWLPKEEAETGPVYQRKPAVREN